MIDLRSDTVTRPTEGMRQAMARRRGRRRRLRRGPDRRRAPGAGRRAVRLRGGAVHPDRVDGQRARAGRAGRSRPGGPLRVARAHPARRARRARRADRADQPHLGQRARAGRPRRDPADARPRHGAVLRAHDGHLGREHPQLRRRHGAAARRPRGRCASLADGLGCGVHVDGARIWNAHVATGTPLASYGAVADTMAVCFSKGLGAPIGSVMLGSAEQVTEARVRRKRMGGGMRQVGVLAAAGLYALDHHLERLAEDHEHARLLAEACGTDPALTETNIVVVDVPDAPAVVAAAREQGVLVGAVGPTKVRMLTHLDVDRAAVEQAAKVLAADPRDRLVGRPAAPRPAPPRGPGRGASAPAARPRPSRAPCAAACAWWSRSIWWVGGLEVGAALAHGSPPSTGSPRRSPGAGTRSRRPSAPGRGWRRTRRPGRRASASTGRPRRPRRAATLARESSTTRPSGMLRGAMGPNLGSTVNGGPRPWAAGGRPGPGRAGRRRRGPGGRRTARSPGRGGRRR